MKPKNKLVVLVMIMMMLMSSCIPININKKTPYDQAISFFNDAWKSYHTVWLLLPEDDKKEWVIKYHNKFKKAGELLQEWASLIDDPSLYTLWDITKDELTTLLITLSIKNI